MGTNETKPKRGAPSLGPHASRARFVVRCTEAEHEHATRAADALGCSLADFIRGAVSERAQRYAVRPVVKS